MSLKARKYKFEEGNSHDIFELELIPEVVLDADINAAINILARLYDSEINLYTSAEKVKEILTKRADAVLSASVETAQLGLQQVVPINLGLSAKSGLSKKSSKKLAKVS